MSQDAKAAGRGVPAWRRWLGQPEASVVLVYLLVLVWIATMGKWDRFADPGNQVNLARYMSMQSIFAVGELLVILTGGIDLSIGSLIAFDGVLLAKVSNTLADQGMAPGTAAGAGIAAVLAFSLALGLVHACLIHFLRLPPFVVTLASMTILRSAAQLINSGVAIPVQRFPLLTFLGNGQFYIAGLPAGIPVAAVVLTVVGLAAALLLSYTRIGRRVYAVGSNEEAARLSGVNVFLVRAFVYGGCSLLTGVAAVLFCGYQQQGDSSAGNMFELNAISAVVIGGAVLTGGRGRVLGTLLGAILLETILNAINLTLTNASFWRGTVVGSVLTAAVVFNRLRYLKRRN